MEKFDINEINGRKLRILVAIFETGSISRAADMFGLNQSTVSHTLETLRTAMKDPLFVKEGRGITPTERTHALMPRVYEVLGALEGLAALDEYDPSNDQLPFGVAIPTPAFLPEMRALHLKLIESAPRSLLKIKRLAPREALPSLLAEAEADLAISVSQPRYPSSLRHMPYSSDELVIFYDAACRDPIATEQDYGSANHVVVDFGGKGTSIVEAELNKRGLSRQVSLVAPTTSMLGDLIKGTQLIATMPRKLALSAYRDLAFCPPPFRLPDVSYDLVWHRRNENSGRNAWLRQLVQKAVAA